ncbi:MAG TPA: galactosyltransferase-related protein, partial [Thermoanaerobaculia bacterium]|nr:galactosyltransferase-related protein [Thermoanaerobaculia bacterium]
MTSAGGRLLVVVPYRARRRHWRALAPALAHHLDGAGLDWRLLVVEQADRRPFNRGLLLNAGFALAAEPGDTVCFHDVDLVPEPACDYSPVDRPTHLAAHVEQLGWELRWEDLFGGVVLFPADDFRRVNGFSNGYWGWGAEDTDLRLRCERAGLAVGRRPGRFRSLAHRPAGDSDRLRRAAASPETAVNR